MCVDPIVAFYSYKKKGFVEFTKLSLFDKRELINCIKKSANKYYIKSGYYQIIPCRKCIGCQLDRSSEWRARLINEAKYYKNNMCFITITYNDNSLHFNNQKIPILFKSDVQNFLKSFRKYYKKDIRYFICGEYGTKTKRPHYHMILFGMNIQDFNDIEIDFTENGFNYYHSFILEHKIWKKGKIILANVDDKCIGYCAGYCVKKVNKEINYNDLNITAPFILASKGKGGIGSMYLKDNRDEIIKNNFKFLSHYNNKTTEVSVPYNQLHYIVNSKSSDYKSLYKKNLMSSQQHEFLFNNISSYIYNLEKNPFYHSSKYFQDRADILKNKINLKEVL